MTGERTFKRRRLWLCGSSGCGGTLGECCGYYEKSSGGEKFHLFCDLRFVRLVKFTFLIAEALCACKRWHG